MHIHRLKKLLIWTLAALIFGGGILSVLETTKAASNPASAFASCTFSIKWKDQSRYYGVIFNNYTFSNDKKTLNFNVKQNNTDKNYTFNFSSVETQPGSTSYQYPNAIYSKAVLNIFAQTSGTPTYFMSNIYSSYGSGEVSAEFNNFMNAFEGAGFEGPCSQEDIFGGNIYNPIIDFHGDKAPTITIPAWTGHRPVMTFELTSALKPVGVAHNTVIFQFTYNGTETKYKQLAIKIFPDATSHFAQCSDPSSFYNCDDLSTDLLFDNNASKQSLWLFYNHVMNAKGTGDNYCGETTTYESTNSDPTKDKKLANWSVDDKPSEKCVNFESPDKDGKGGGWLAHWGIKGDVQSWTSESETGGTGDCGGILLFVTKGVVAGAIDNLLCTLIKLIAGVGEWIVNIFGIATQINAYHSPPTKQLTQIFLPSPSVAHAATPAGSSIKEALNGNPGWVLATWKMVLGLADVFIVIVLLFLALTNILHIQYDTYAIKKSLPTLIIGIILANFSIFITKMLVDATNALTATFTGGDPGGLLAGLITATTQTKEVSSTGALFITVLFGIFSIIVFIIIGFLFWIRYAVILVLTIAAPLAFVLMAFPPTAGFFKQWLSWYFKFIFMKPISVFLIWMAAESLKLGSGNHLTGWAMAVFLLIAAIIVPFKMGGAVMSAWGGLGKKGAGWLGNKADYGMAKYLKWSPKSAYQAYKMGSEEQREKAYNEAIGTSRDIWNRALSLGKRKTRYGERARRAWGRKVYKEYAADIGAESGEELARLLEEVDRTGDKNAVRELFVSAAENNMVSDMMRGASQRLKKKYGYDPTKALPDDFGDQKEFAKRVAGDSPQFLNKLEDAWTKSGISNAKENFVDAEGNAVTLAPEQARNAHIARFHSKAAGQGVREWRIDGYLKEGRLTQEFMDELGEDLFDESHLTYWARGIGREKSYKMFAQAENWAILGQTAKGRKMQAALTQAGYGPVYSQNQARQVSVGTDTLNIGEIDADTASRPEVVNEITRQTRDIDINFLDELRTNIEGNANLGPIHANIRSIVDLRRTLNQAQQIPSQNRTDADHAMSRIALTIANNIGRGVRSGIDPKKIVASALRAAGPEERSHFLNVIQTNMRTNPRMVIRPAGHPISLADTVHLWQTHATSDEAQSKVNFSAALDHLGASPEEKHQAMMVIDAYRGIEPPPRIRRRGGFYEEEEEFE